MKIYDIKKADRVLWAWSFITTYYAIWKRSNKET